ncbi:Di-copper centre-containing protein, partial [Ramicandelaber brevisporus]
KRREIRTMSYDAISRFVNATAVLHTQPSAKYPGLSVLDEYARDHVSVGTQVHLSMRFFPFHRVFISKFEDKLREIDPLIEGLPYLETGLDANAPEKSPAFRYFGSSQGKGPNQPACMTDGPMSGWSYTLDSSKPNADCVSREFDSNPPSSSPKFQIPSFAHLQTMISSIAGFGDFSVMTEFTHHGYWHQFIGGTMKTMASPRDPFMFYTLHAMLDKAWLQWQELHDKERNKYAGGDATE